MTLQERMLAEKKVNSKRHAELQKRLLAIDQFLHNSFAIHAKYKSFSKSTPSTTLSK